MKKSHSVTSLQSREFTSLTAFRTHLQGTKDFTKVLVANNGLAAVKGIRSIRAWLYDHIGNQEAISFAVMATPEDLKVNAEFISMADQHVEVLGGANSNNYANVELIVHTALQLGCDAVYPGWGHASENPALPRELERSRKVTFLGPPEAPMFALGDKIASTIIAQSNGVPTVPWSGDHIRLPANTFYIDPVVYETSYIKSPEECEEVVRRIGLPVMIKASEGGGGKGIRKVLKMEDVSDMYKAVVEEVKGCHVFVMRMLDNVRHLEVQLLADKYGNCIAVRTRDCSVQRRHQKIIEEGPVVGVDPEVVVAMEQAAIRLALAVGYCGLGTVEYMYDKSEGTYCFLELNPRIQVEHPVSELISGVNLPAALLCTGMGIPLYRIPEVRAFYGEDPYGSSVIDFTKRQSLAPRCHAIAVRITAEDVDEGFRPTTGNIDEISFHNSKECWGYFSVAGGGGVHQFADSQFGHIFSTGETREDARRGMVLALRGLTVRGEIRTSTAYVVELLETREFRDSDVSTSWLDGLIATKIKSAASDVFSSYPALAAASIYRMKRFEEGNIEKYNSFLHAGHTPSVDYLSNCKVETFVLHSQKYQIEVRKLNSSDYSLRLNDSILTVPCRQLNTGGLQLTIGSRALVVYSEEEPTSLRITINGKSTTFTGDIDPTKLRSSVPGRLVRFLVPDGGHISEGSAFAEVEVMKMILQLRSAVSGTVSIRATTGSTVNIGRLLAEVEPDDISKVSRAVMNSDPWPENMLSPNGAAASLNTSPSRSSSGGLDQRVDSITRAREAIDTIWFLMQGYQPDPTTLKQRLANAIDGLSTLSLTAVQLRLLNRPYLSHEKYPNATTPNEKLKAFYECIVGAYLAVEQNFDGRTRQEAIDLLRGPSTPITAAAPSSATTATATSNGVFELDFAHQHNHRHDVMKALLQNMERNRLLMTSCKPILESIAKLQSSVPYGTVLLQSRYLLRQCNLPSFDDRRAQLAKDLEEGNVETLLQGSYGFDLMCGVMYDVRSPHLAQLAVELFIRRSHYGVSKLENIDIFKHDGVLQAAFRFDSLEDQDPLFLEGLSGSSRFPQSPPSNADGGEADTEVSGGMGFVFMYVDDQDLLKKFPNFVERVVIDSSSSKSVATIIFAVRLDATSAFMVDKCAEIVSNSKRELLKTSLELLTFIVHGAAGGPHIFTYRRQLGFGEETLYRNVIPTSASRLELKRLTKYSITMFPTPHRQVHIYTATPRTSKFSSVEFRIFIRMFISPRDLGLAPWSTITEVDCGQALDMCLAAIEFSRADKKLGQTVFNHLFINMIQLTFDLTTLTSSLKRLSESYAKKLYQLGIRELELKFKAVTKEGYIPFRVYLMNHTGYALVIRTFVETYRDGIVTLRRAEHQEDIDDLPLGSAGRGGLSSLMSSNNVDSMEGSGEDVLGRRSQNNSSNDVTGTPKMQMPGSPHTGSPGAGLSRIKSSKKMEALRGILPPRPEEPFAPSTLPTDSFSAFQTSAAMDGDAIPLDPYPPLPAKQVKRLLAQSLQTTFVKDWIVLIEVALRQRWKEFVKARKLPPTAVPNHVVHGQPLYSNDAGTALTTTPSSAPCGMAVWEMEFSPPTYVNVSNLSPAKRRIIVVANDITFQSGSFAVPEDVVFMLASVYARERKLPFVYLSANSGARLGLCDDVKQKLRAAVHNDTLEYVYLTEQDYTELTSRNVKLITQVRVIEPTGEKRYQVLDVIGGDKDYLGVENLQGSALVAGHMSLNYATIPTISVATGRTVGIGAYLVRLGRRVVQVRNAPIILTGASALNRLLGKEVYSDNNQLGGNQIMVPNGVTHWEAKDDLCAIHTVLQWLDFVPSECDPSTCNPRTLSFPIHDPIDRDVTYMPRRDESYDPRNLVEGTATATGMFDKGTWQESLAGWAKSVVTGRAALGGVPCGVILVETRITQKFDPADPADLTSISSFTSQAGQVWFPDSARKTAEALEDFHRERLPCFVFANWRGFSGGMRDMFDEVLKFGASIVENLRVYTAPVYVYIPPFGELRGGAWVVVDPVINHSGVVQMYCDHTSRGGILEPSGVVEIKFRENDVRDLIRRSDAKLQTLLASSVPADVVAAKKREADLLPLYTDIAVHFADLHDTPGRMQAKKCVLGVVPWKDSRRTFSAKLNRRLVELRVAQKMALGNTPAPTPTSTPADAAPLMHAALDQLEQRYYTEFPPASTATSQRYHDDDVHVLQWLSRLESSSQQPTPNAMRVAPPTAKPLLESPGDAIGRLLKGMTQAERVECLKALMQSDAAVGTDVRSAVESCSNAPK